MHFIRVCRRCAALSIHTCITVVGFFLQKTVLNILGGDEKNDERKYVNIYAILAQSATVVIFASVNLSAYIAVGAIIYGDKRTID